VLEENFVSGAKPHLDINFSSTKKLNEGLIEKTKRRGNQKRRVSYDTFCKHH